MLSSTELVYLHITDDKFLKNIVTKIWKKHKFDSSTILNV